MKLHVKVDNLLLANPFTISRGTITRQRTVIVQLEAEGLIGFGEVPESDFYGHSAESILSSIEQMRPLIEEVELTCHDAVWEKLRGPLAQDMFALCATDMAANDLYGKLKGKRCFEVWGLTWSEIPDSSFTLSLGTPKQVVLEYLQNPGWRIYKLKLGGASDLDIVSALRDQTDAVLRVDANCAWSAREAIEKSGSLHDLGVEFIEQPLPAEASVESHALVHRESALPIIADESCCTAVDVERCAGLFHGINVKLCKCGGLTPALQMLHRARALGMLTMVGCMVETSIGISAAAQLLPLLNYADLDGALLLKDDPAKGVIIQKGKVSLPAGMGCGGNIPSTDAQHSKS